MASKTARQRKKELKRLEKHLKNRKLSHIPDEDLFAEALYCRWWGKDEEALEVLYEACERSDSIEGKLSDEVVDDDIDKYDDIVESMRKAGF